MANRSFKLRSFKPLRTQKFSGKREVWAEWMRETARHQVRWHGDPPRELRWKVIAGAVLGTFVFGYVGFQLLTSNFHTSETPVAIIPKNGLAPASPTPSASATTATVAQILTANAYDPFGNDQENDAQSKLALDDSATTSWTTATYKAADTGKAGVGLVLDLGEAKPVSAVKVTFPTAGHSFTVYVGDVATPDVKTAEKLGSISGATTDAVVKTTKPITGRYVTIWLTTLPAVTDGFSGGIANVQVLL